MRVTAVNRVCTAAVYYHLISGVGIRRRRNGADKSSGVDATVTYITHVKHNPPSNNVIRTQI
jgi:hypothetical protein